MWLAVLMALNQCVQQKFWTWVIFTLDIPFDEILSSINLQKDVFFMKKNLFNMFVFEKGN